MPRRVPAYRRSREFDRYQGTNFTASTSWRKCRASYLAENPLCEDCRAQGRTEVATEVHHKVMRALRPDLAFEWDNLMPLCKPCHSARTARGE